MRKILLLLLIVFVAVGTYAQSGDRGGGGSRGGTGSAPVISDFTIESTFTNTGKVIYTIKATDDVGVTGYWVTYNLNEHPVATSSGWSASASGSYTLPDKEGIYQLAAWAKDGSGNVSGSYFIRGVGKDILYDKTLPLISAFTLPKSTVSPTIIMGIAATDNNSVSGYFISQSSTTPAVNSVGWTATVPASFTLTHEGPTTLSLWVKDIAGNVSAVKTATVTYNVAPVITAFSIPKTSTGSTIALSVTATDNLGVTGYYVSESSVVPTPTATGWLSAKPDTYTLTKEGKTTLYLWAKDAAGNVSAAKTATVTYNVAPVVTAFSIPQTSTGSTIALSVTATDNFGVTGYYVSESSVVPTPTAIGWLLAKPDTYTLTKEGKTTLYLWAKDAAGNISTQRSATVDYQSPEDNLTGGGVNLAGGSVDTPAEDLSVPVIETFTAPSTTRSATVSLAINATDNVGVTGYYISESSIVPVLSSADWKPEKPTSYTFSHEGNHQLYLWVMDAAGNISESKIVYVFYKITSPVVTSFTAPTTTNTATVSLIIDVNNNVGLTHYYLSENSTVPTLTSADWKIEKPTSYTFSQEGNNTLYLWIKDAPGIISALSSVTVIYDKTAPVISGFTAPSTSTTATVSLTIDAVDNFGVTGYWLSESSTVPASYWGGWRIEKPTSYTFSQEGNNTLYLWVRDAVGNISARKYVMVNYDKTVPVISSFTAPSTSTTSNVSLAINTTDNVGVTGYYLSENSDPSTTSADWKPEKPTSYTFSQEGNHTLYLWVKDAAGNISELKSLTILYDKKAPVISNFTASAANTATVSLTIDATDNVGVTGYYLSENSTVPTLSLADWKPEKPTSYTFSLEGSNTLYLWAKDATGNISVLKSVTVIYDKTVPVISSFTAPSSTKTAIVSLAINATDNVGVTGYYLSENSNPTTTSADWKPEKPTSYTFSKEGNHTLYLWVKDASGNISVLKSVTIIYDKTAPVISGFTAPFTSTTATVSLTIDAVDNFGVTGYYLSESSTVPTLSSADWKPEKPTSCTFSQEGNHTLYLWVKDASDNISVLKKVFVLFDITAPVISRFTAPSNTNKATVLLTIDATDNVGVTGYYLSSNSTVPTISSADWKPEKPTSYTFSKEGSYTLCLWVKDAAGHIGVLTSVTVIYDITAPVITKFLVDHKLRSNNATVTVDTNSSSDPLAALGYYLSTNISDWELWYYKSNPGKDAIWVDRLPTSVNVDGLSICFLWIKDLAGNISSPVMARIYIDRTAPEIYTVVPDASSITSQRIGFEVTASDHNGVGLENWCYVGTTNDKGMSAKVDLDGSNHGVYNIPMDNVLLDKDYTLYFWAEDKNGNVSNPISVTVKYTCPDREKPVIQSFTAPLYTNAKTVACTVAATDKTGVAGYFLGLTDATPPLTSDSWTASAPTQLTLPDGLKTGDNRLFYLWVKDAFGNISEPKGVSVTFDDTAPVFKNWKAPYTVKTASVFVNYTVEDLFPNLTYYTGMFKTESECTNFYKNYLSELPAEVWSLSQPKEIWLSLNAAEFKSAALRVYMILAKDAAGNIGFQIGTAWYCPMCKSGTIPGENSTPAGSLTTGTDGLFQPAALEVKAYPNPFTNDVTISVTTGTQSKLKVEITDMTGSLVRTIYDGEPGVSQLNLQWDGTNGQNRRVSPGVYFCRVNNQVIKLIRK